MTCKQGGTTSVRSLWTDFVMDTASHSDTLALLRLGNPCASVPTMKHHKKLTMPDLDGENESTTKTSPPAVETLLSSSVRNAFYAGFVVSSPTLTVKEAYEAYNNSTWGYKKYDWRVLPPVVPHPKLKLD